jgi:hypothetical protein
MMEEINLEIRNLKLKTMELNAVLKSHIATIISRGPPHPSFF